MQNLGHRIFRVMAMGTLVLMTVLFITACDQDNGGTQMTTENAAATNTTATTEAIETSETVSSAASPELFFLGRASVRILLPSGKTVISILLKAIRAVIRFPLIMF